MRFFVNISDFFPTIENIKNENSNKDMSSDNLTKLLQNINQDDLYFIVDSKYYDVFKECKTIGEDPRCDIVIIRDDNIDAFNTIEQLGEVYLFVNNVNNFFTNFKKIYNKCSSIEFKLDELSHYDINLFEENLKSIYEYVLSNFQETKQMPLIKQLNSFMTKEKFNLFGDTDFFIDQQLNVYPHPSFYYSKYQIKTQSIFEFDFEKYHQITKPHLICLNCECFYCDRDIYRNKMKTNEFITPCFNSCEMNSILSKYSKKLFNHLFNLDFEEDICFNDFIKNFIPSKEYARFMNKECKCNFVKKIDFLERKLPGDFYR